MRRASFSRQTHPNNNTTKCIHTVEAANGHIQDSIMSLCSHPSKPWLFAGTQTGTVLVINTQNFQLIHSLRCPNDETSGRPVLCMTFVSHKIKMNEEEIEMEEELLISGGSGDGVLRAWNLKTMELEFTIHAGHDCGDVYSMVYSPTANCLYISCKNQSIQWFPLASRDSLCRQSMKQEWLGRDSRFFQRSQSSVDNISVELAEGQCGGHKTFMILQHMIMPMCHNGFIYTLLLTTLPNHSGKQQYLLSGAGDGKVKVWETQQQQQQMKPKLLQTLQASSGAVLSICTRDGLLYTGAQSGTIRVWDLETWHCIRALADPQMDDIMSLSVCGQFVYSGCANGTIRRWSPAFECVETLHDSQIPVLALLSNDELFVAGYGDGKVKFFHNAISSANESDSNSVHHHHQVKSGSDRLLADLEALVKCKSISGDERYREDCRMCAKQLKSLLTHLGAEAKIVATGGAHNPLVIAKFTTSTTSNSNSDKSNILFYGHYDVQPAENREQWQSDPFQMEGRDGYLYGRGVSDNKGPILAAIYATCELYETRQLTSNVYFLIEGEEEAGSGGFFETVQQNREFFLQDGPIGAVLISNSYWINDESPCLTFGLRGVVHARVEIKSPIEADLHSGVHGGVQNEPLVDLIKVLSELYSNNSDVSHNQILIPHFNDSVRPLSKEELQKYSEIAKHISKNEDELSSVEQKLQNRWRFPTLTIHNVQVSGPSHSNTVIPKSAQAAVSMRLVPDQQLDQIISSFQHHISQSFKRLNSKNRFTLSIGHRADWWVADQNSRVYRLAAQSIREEWGVEPLHIREGGSIPAIPFLEKYFNAPAVHIPLGQASDNAHLPDERIRIQNLLAGVSVIKRFLTKM